MMASWRRFLCKRHWGLLLALGATLLLVGHRPSLSQCRREVREVPGNSRPPAAGRRPPTVGLGPEACGSVAGDGRAGAALGGAAGAGRTGGPAAARLVGLVPAGEKNTSGLGPPLQRTRGGRAVTGTRGHVSDTGDTGDSVSRGHPNTGDTQEAVGTRRGRVEMGAAAMTPTISAISTTPRNIPVPTTQGKTSKPKPKPTVSVEWQRAIARYLEAQLENCKKDEVGRNASGDARPLCACAPDTLLGTVDVNLTLTTASPTTASAGPGLPARGYWSPADCTPRSKVVVVVPYRARSDHLAVLLRHLPAVLRGQQANFTILVVEQGRPEVFNKAAVMNVGFHYATRHLAADCVIFHDVDFLPEDGRHFYRCHHHGPLHLGAFHNAHDYRLIYTSIFGGVTAFTPAQFRLVNGFSNRYFGWGGEDDDMGMRVLAKFRKIQRDPREVAGYRVLRHERDPGNVQRDRGGMLQHLFHHRDNAHDGINSLRFALRQRVVYPLYTWVLVDILEQAKKDVSKL